MVKLLCCAQLPTLADYALRRRFDYRSATTAVSRRAALSRIAARCMRFTVRPCRRRKEAGFVMLGKQAKLISPSMLSAMLAHVKANRYATRDQAVILLSAKAGLRACEIAGLDWSMVLDARGQIADAIDIRSHIAKGQSGRRVPMHGDLQSALKRLMKVDDASGPIIRSARGGAMRANSIVNWFVSLYAELEFEGCSSHSGRRTFITTAARNVAKVGCSLRDVQLLAGHRSIETTQRYIEGDTTAQRRLVGLV